MPTLWLQIVYFLHFIRLPELTCDVAVPPAIAHNRPTEYAAVLLQVSGLTKRYGDQRALADVSFSVQASEVLGLIGPNGAGKTTLLEAIAGILPADSGDVLWRGTPLALSQRRKSMFYLPEGLRPWEDQYVVRVIELFATIYGKSESSVSDTVRSLGLSPVLRKRVLALSKGYSRRLMLALALMTPHQLLLMDEPFDGFDLRQTREIMHVLRKVAVGGRTLVLAIHQLSDAERVCDRFVLLADGRVRGIGTLAELRARTEMPSAGLEDVFLALT
jgi:ABC-2 type transport system ATP-binding protein